MSKGAAPSAPDPYATAASQYQYGTKAAQASSALNDLNTSGPTGSSSYNITGTDPATGMPIRTQTTTLSPAEQALFSTGENVKSGLLNNAGNMLPNLASGVESAPNLAPINYNIDTSGVPALPDVQGMNGLQQYGQKTALAGEMAALQPSQNAQLEQTKAMLINSGNPPGSPAYESAMSQLNAQLGSQDTQAAGAAISAGTGLQNTTYGEMANNNQQAFSQAAAKAGFTNSADLTALQSWAQQNNIPLSSITQMLSAGAAAGPSSLAPTSAGVSAPDIMSAFQNQYAGQLAGYNANVASTNGLIGDAATLGALGIMMS